MQKNLLIVGVGPGSPQYLTCVAMEAIRKSKYIIGYKYTLDIVESIIDRTRQEVYHVTMLNQDSIYQDVYNKMKDGEYCAVPFTGDANFSESEVVDRLLEIFGDNSEIIPGISSIQVASSKSKIPLDKSYVLSFHVSGDIDKKKKELINAIMAKKSVILLPRPWPNDPSKNFMQSDIVKFLKLKGIDTSTLKVWVFEYLTKYNKETIFRGKASDLEEMSFNPLSVMVIDQNKRYTYRVSFTRKKDTLNST
ncbi:MAG: precorrin-6y C5,15-methyltransferase (decarboxylating) subunit CbiE [Nitrososphaeraceae archaeon]